MDFGDHLVDITAEFVDAYLLNKTNIRSLEKDGYILGARIKTLKENKKKEILDKKLKHGDITSIALEPGRRMVVTMSDERAKKNAAAGTSITLQRARFLVEKIYIEAACAGRK